MLRVMNSDTKKTESDQMFYAAEQAGLKLAIKGRIITVVFVATLPTVLTRSCRFWKLFRITKSLVILKLVTKQQLQS